MMPRPRKIHRSEGSYDTTEDIREMEETKRAHEESAEFSSWKALLQDPVERRKVIYSAGAMFSSQVNGILFFYVYGVVFAQAIGMKDPFLIQLITNILQIFAVGASVLTGNKVRRRINLFVTNGMMMVAFIVIGGVGTQGALTTAGQYVIVIFSYIVIIGYNFGIGPLAYTIARETAVGTNQNKIMSVSIVVFYFITWLISFTAPYLYYDAGLGPMLGFIYAGTTALTQVYTYFCVGETAGRSTMEISMFFSHGIPAWRWRTHVFADLTDEKVLEGDDIGKLEKGASNGSIPTKSEHENQV